MAKKKKDLRVEILKELNGRKYFLTWEEHGSNSLIIEARNKEEAEEKFYRGEFDWNDVEIQDSDFNDGSLDIEEVEE